MKKTIPILIVFALLCVLSSLSVIGASCTSVPVEDCTVDGDLNLSGGTFYLNDSNNNGAIIINTNNIVLDCNDSTIVNGGAQVGIGIMVNQKTNVTIKNCNIDGRGEMGNWTDTGNWTDMGSNIWKFSDTTVPKRVFLNDTEYGMSQYNTTLNESNRWFSNSTTGFYVYAPENPANHYTSIKEPMFEVGIKFFKASNITLININLTGASGQALFIQGSSNNTIHSSNIGMWSVVGVRNTREGTTKSENNLFYNNTFDSGHNFQNTWNIDGGGDAIQFPDGAWNNTVRDSTFINWGHTAFYIDTQSTSSSLCAKYNKFYNNKISMDGLTYGRGLGIDGGGKSCSEFNEIYNVNITNTTVRNQLNGNNNSIYNIIIDTMTNSPRTAGVAQGIDVDDYCGACVSYNNTFTNITIKNTEEACVRIGQNTTGNRFINLKLTNCASNTQVGRSFDIHSLNINAPDIIPTASFLNGLKTNGIMRYGNINSAINITVNETSTIKHNFSFNNNGRIQFIYNGRKDFRVENNTITINNMPTSNNQIFNQTSNTPTATNVNTFTETIPPNNRSFVFSYLTASQPTFSSIALTVTDMSYTFSGNVLTIGCTGTGNTVTTNMEVLKGTHSFYSHTKDGVLQGFSSTDDFTITDCSIHTFQGATPPLSFLSRISSVILRSGLAVFLAIFILISLSIPLVRFNELNWDTKQWINYFIISIISIFLIIILIEQIFNV